MFLLFFIPSFLCITFVVSKPVVRYMHCILFTAGYAVVLFSLKAKAVPLHAMKELGWR
jgi:hypothetical protein